MAKENESREGGGEIFAPPREEESKGNKREQERVEEEEHPTKIRPFSRPFVEINLTPISFWTDGRFVFHVQTKKASRFPFFFFFPLSVIVRRPTTLA